MTNRKLNEAIGKVIPMLCECPNCRQFQTAEKRCQYSPPFINDHAVEEKIKEIQLQVTRQTECELVGLNKKLHELVVLAQKARHTEK